MSYNEQLRDRVRQMLPAKMAVVEKKMFGGVTFMVNGKMCIGILKDEIMARIDPAVYEKALRRKGCHEMRFTGKPMKGFVFVSPEGMKSKKDLEYWINLAVEFNKIAKASKSVHENDYLGKITKLLKQVRPKLSTTHILEFKNVFGAVGGYVNGKIFIACGKFGIALRLPPDTLATLFQKKEATYLKYFQNGHIKKEYAVLSRQVLENKRRLKKLGNESIKFVLK